jgi:hypothetical protein
MVVAAAAVVGEASSRLGDVGVMSGLCHWVRIGRERRIEGCRQPAGLTRKDHLS